MKKIFSFFTLFVFIIIVFFNNTIMSFAMQDNKMSFASQNDMIMKMETNLIDLCDNNEKEDKGNNNSCCFETEGAIMISASNISKENNKKIKIKVKNYTDIYYFAFNSPKERKIARKIFPPNLPGSIKNYSYKDLIKIIKSNI